MIITKAKALESVESGKAYYVGRTSSAEAGDNGAWILTNTTHMRTDHCGISDDETMIGCISCGNIVEPESDRVGIGCHCPICDATL